MPSNFNALSAAPATASLANNLREWEFDQLQYYCVVLIIAGSYFLLSVRNEI